MKKILVIVVMQNDFIDGALGTPEARSIVDNICEKIKYEEWDRVYIIQDTHDNNYLQTQEGKFLPIEHCIRSNRGWGIHSRIFGSIIGSSDWTWLYKSTFDCLELVENVFDESIDVSDTEVTLVGVCTDICVISNALLLKTHFPELKIVVDASCCAGSNPEKHLAALEVMKSCQIYVVNE